LKNEARNRDRKIQPGEIISITVMTGPSPAVRSMMKKIIDAFVNFGSN